MEETRSASCRQPATAGGASAHRTSRGATTSFYNNPKDPGSGLAPAREAIAALNTDFDWLREHACLGARPSGMAAQRTGCRWRYCRGKGSAAAQNAPEPTALHLTHPRERSGAEAQSNAQPSSSRRWRPPSESPASSRRGAQTATMAKIRNMALAAVSILALLAGWLYWHAEQQRATAGQIRWRREYCADVRRSNEGRRRKKRVLALFELVQSMAS